MRLDVLGIMPTSKIRVSSQGPYADWLVNEDDTAADLLRQHGIWPHGYLPNAGHPQGDHLRVDTVSGAECTIIWEK